MDDTMTSEWIHMYTFCVGRSSQNAKLGLRLLDVSTIRHSTRHSNSTQIFAFAHTSSAAFWSNQTNHIRWSVFGLCVNLFELVAAALRRICAERCAQETLRKYTWSVRENWLSSTKYSKSSKSPWTATTTLAIWCLKHVSVYWTK